jgi:hypothetical protein
MANGLHRTSPTVYAVFAYGLGHSCRKFASRESSEDPHGQRAARSDAQLTAQEGFLVKVEDVMVSDAASRGAVSHVR